MWYAPTCKCVEVLCIVSPISTISQFSNQDSRPSPFSNQRLTPLVDRVLEGDSIHPSWLNVNVNVNVFSHLMTSGPHLLSPVRTPSVTPITTEQQPQHQNNSYNNVITITTSTIYPPPPTYPPTSATTTTTRGVYPETH